MNKAQLTLKCVHVLYKNQLLLFGTASIFPAFIKRFEKYLHAALEDGYI